MRGYVLRLASGVPLLATCCVVVLCRPCAVGVALQEGVLVMEEEDSSASNPLANPMMDPMNMVYAFHRRRE